MGSGILRESGKKSNASHNIVLGKSVPPAFGRLKPIGASFVMHHRLTDGAPCGGRTFAVYQCECGTVHIAACSNVRSGAIQSCGCFDRERRSTHGHSDTLTYNSWKSMMARCYREAHPHFDNYGGRGIVVCDRWQHFPNFLQDMGERPSRGHSIDRYPNANGNYEPGNCRWATRHEQRANASNARFLTINNQTMTAFEWSQQRGAVNYGAILGRLSRGWPDSDAVFSPLQRKGIPLTEPKGAS